MTATIKIEHVRYAYESGMEPVLKDIEFTANPGEITSIVGPNGTGKTTLLRCIADLLKCDGRVLFDEQELSHSEKVSRMSYMEQNTDCSINLTVFEVVMLGLVNSLGFRVSDEDIERVNKVLELVGIDHLAGSGITEISGGQRQLAFIAQALGKEPDVLILDEPTSALDLYNQYTLMNFIKNVTKEKNCTTIVTLHHLDVALKYSDKVVVVNKGVVYADDASSEVFTQEMLYDVYKVFSKIETDQYGDRHIIVLRPRLNDDPPCWADLMNGVDTNGDKINQ